MASPNPISLIKFSISRSSFASPFFTSFFFSKSSMDLNPANSRSFQRSSFSTSCSLSPPLRESQRRELPYDWAITLEEWQGWGPTTSVPAIITDAIAYLRDVEAASDAQMSFGGNGGRFQLLGDFESCAEIFIPLVVITVLVIAESADNCIKTMLRNCKVARILPRIADSVKNDRNAVLRARCCEYALLVLEHWPDAPEIHRSADKYEDLIKCCVGDAMSEDTLSKRLASQSPPLTGEGDSSTSDVDHTKLFLDIEGVKKKKKV